MKQRELAHILKRVVTILRSVILVISLLLTTSLFYLLRPYFEASNKQVVVAINNDLIENGIHVQTGLLDGEELNLVINNCTGCHSAKMIIQNRASKEGWKSMIRWMQQTQNLWDLGENEDAILEYLARNYPPQEKGRRSKLSNIEWYELE